uniref:Putative mitochondrial ATP synthase gamma chain n=1 Tax=Taeniopygia guttata TaxID=59729 RepID=B5G249_TAEGU|nr:putative mitochondrial ATP synthase gamma chain [Taeniopygia guttata]
MGPSQEYGNAKRHHQAFEVHQEHPEDHQVHEDGFCSQIRKS